MASGDTGVKKEKIEHKDSQAYITDLSKFVLKRIISCNNYRKTICFEGNFTDKDGTALLFLEKSMMNSKTVEELFSEKVTLYKNSETDDTYEFIPEQQLNSMKVTLVFPATEWHIKKYEVYPMHLIHETPELNRDVTMPCVMNGKVNLNWVYNILAHEAEQENVVFEDDDPKTGFMFLPDLKWNQKQIESLYMMAIVRPSGIKSLRDITSDHLPLLKNIKKKGVAVIKEKYGLEECQLRIYVHYLPSYYHFHVHFTNIDYPAPGIITTRAHLLDTIITNLQIVSDYYQKATLAITVKETDNLFLAYKDKGLVTEVPKIEEAVKTV